MTTRNLLAFDLGAESGRAILGRFDGELLTLEELHRFANNPVRLFDRLYWNPLGLFAEMKQGLALAARQQNISVDSVGIDTWGVDFALLGPDDALLDNPRNYRDPRTDGMLEQAFDRVPREEIFAHTGIQFMKLNTLYQLLSMRSSPLLEQAKTLLLMGDLFHFFFTGSKVCEFSNATTTQFYDPSAKDWARELLNKLEIPHHFLPPIVAPGTQLGQLLPSIAEELGVAPMPFIAPATHDTGSAVAAVPTEDANYAYISSGTWSLMGVEIAEPLLGPEALRYNFTNEGGVGRTYRFLKNIMGLWLVQECRRAWEREGQTYSYGELTDMAAQAPAFTALVDPDDERFIAPGDMPARLRGFCGETDQPVPGDVGTIVRGALESLALKYRYVLESLENILGRKLERIHIVGGGIQNRLLCQFTADATQRPVIAGPIEATAIGNLLVQAIGLGEIGNLDEARQIVRRSFAPDLYTPGPAAGWDEAYGRFCQLLPAR
ncbi:MAG: rhamnulokinase [Candidatus Latescibacterota bacterium]|jgi:rhamnulokinase